MNRHRCNTQRETYTLAPLNSSQIRITFQPKPAAAGSAACNFNSLLAWHCHHGHHHHLDLSLPSSSSSSASPAFALSLRTHPHKLGHDAFDNVCARARRANSLVHHARISTGSRWWWCRCCNHLHWRSDHLGLHTSALDAAPSTPGLARHHLDHHSRLRQQLEHRQRPQPGLRYGLVQRRSQAAHLVPFHVQRRLGHLYGRCRRRCRCPPSLSQHAKGQALEHLVADQGSTFRAQSILD